MLKKKSANFTKAEIDVMVAEIHTRRDVLFGKLGVGLSGEMKKKAWEEVAAKVNEVGVGEVRTEKAIRKKWTDMSSLMKKKESARRREMKVTGGGECDVKMTDTEVRIVDLLTEEAVGGVAGGMDIGMIQVQVHEEVVTDAMDMKYMMVQSDAGGSGVMDQESKDVEETIRVEKKTSSGKRAKDLEDLTEIELKRLKVEEKRLEIEMRRLEVEEKRLAMENERWELEKRRAEWMLPCELVNPVGFRDE